ncbi:hypothetical protein F5148DRAFT_1149621 [Russula earlei]|uniref:Uncharacterized protein n=1 Tax=Russula earlei TaxID=71964 RepID=A0ACC0U8F3_9AGAM|nr:hypothetical protein F5148DRAFT_1149621 [Russula earlei]
MHDTDDSPWDDAPTAATTHAEAEWTRLSSHFQNAGYRDGITAGKEGALQEGFDAGFARAGAPRGRELGLLRGLASASLLHLSRGSRGSHAQASAAQRAVPATSTALVREIVDALAAVRFADIAPAPPPEEAEHAHGAAEDGMDRDGPGQASVGLRSTGMSIEDVRELRARLEAVLREAGIKVDLDLDA